MREFLEAVLDDSGKAILDLHYVLPAVLAIGIVVLLLSPWRALRRFFTGLMAAVWLFFGLWMVLDAIETFTYDREYGFFLLIFPADYMGLSLVLSAIGLMLHRVRRKREAAGTLSAHAAMGSGKR